MIELWDYQSRLNIKTRNALAKFRKVLMCSATGSGKTVMAGDLCKRAYKAGYKPLFLTDRIEIAKKTAKTFQEGFEMDVQLVDADTDVIWKTDCYVAMAETIYRRCLAGRFPMSKIGMIFCDEAHMKIFEKVINLFPNTFIIGLTATPVSYSFNMNKLYETIVMGPKVSHLIEQGYLCPAVEFGSSEYTRLKAGSTEFTSKYQREVFTQNNLDSKGFAIWQARARNRSTLVYNIDREHNTAVSERFKALGVSCESVDSKTPQKDRDKIFDDFSEGRLQVVCNVDIATKGFDAPITDCIIYNRITKSLSAFKQAAGRGARKREGKKDFIFIDPCNNLDRMGSFNEDIDWEYLFHHPEEDIKNKPKQPTKLCPSCYAFVTNVFISKCSVCNSEISAKTLLKLEDQLPDNLKDKPLTEMTLKEMQTYGKYKGYKPGWAWFKYNTLNRQTFNK